MVVDESRSLTSPPEDSGPPSGSTTMARLVGVGRILIGALLFGGVLLAAVREWSAIGDTVAKISLTQLVGAELLALAGLLASAFTWRRVLRELGSPLKVAPAFKIYLVGQLAKYVPGSLWVFIVQMEMGRKATVPRLRFIAAGLVAILLNVVVGLAMGAAVVPTVADGELWRYVLLSLLFAVTAIALVPRVQRWIMARLSRVGGGWFEGRGDLSWSGLGVGLGWSALSWLSYGLSLWVIAVAAGAPAASSLWLCLAGVPLAMTAGFVVFVAPSGIGVREAVLVAALAPVLEPESALAVALVLRLVFTVADLLAAAASAGVRIDERALSTG